MRILFVHQNFPGQFKHLAPALAADPRNQVVAMTMRKDSPSEWQGVHLVHYRGSRNSTAGIHPWLVNFESQIIRAEAAFHTATKLRESGFMPDVIIAHPAWGESLFLKNVWPESKLGIYCEFFLHTPGADDFDPEFRVSQPSDSCRLKILNLNSAMHFDIADAGISPTPWQASVFPDFFRNKITVVHDGVDCDAIAPDSNVTLTLNQTLHLSRKNEVITFINRNLEPLRGYHIFMRALPEILRRRPHAHVLIIGGDQVSYGARPPDGKKWKDIFLAEVKDQLDMNRVHFMGVLPHEHLVSILQLSSVHVYLTYPFVLSWSLLEAMSVGCAIVASNTEPLHGIIRDDETGKLVDFFHTTALSDQVCTLLEQPEQRAQLGKNARDFVKANYDLKSVCLPRQIEWVNKIATQQR